MEQSEPVEEKIIREPIRKVCEQGRNSPCRCGSGKKFKKCCLTKRGVADESSDKD